MSMSRDGIAPNASRLLWAGFMAILATGIGFAIRGGILDNWKAEFGFTDLQLGEIGGAGFNGFCFGIILGGVIVDRIGYGKLVVLAFLLHVISAIVSYLAGGSSAYSFLYWGAFIFAYANGTLEAVANPLVATLFPTKRTHYLNILHASWPGGLVLGAVVGWVLDDKLQVSWRIQLAIYLVATLTYGLMFLGQHFPRSEAAQKGMGLGTMFQDIGMKGALVASALVALFLISILGGFRHSDGTPLLDPDAAKTYGWAAGAAMVVAVGVITRFSFGSFVLFTLFVAHALIGSVELGTDSWIQNITGNLFSSEQGKFLFMWTSLIMFSLRFCAHWIETRLRLSPVGLLLSCAVLACLGLNLASAMTTFTMAILALSVYAVGKTFFWPTMLAVASDRFPRTGAIAISMMGGIGMLSAGMIGIPGLGYCKDRFAGEALAAANPAVWAESKAAEPSKFLNLDSTAAHGLDGKKLADAAALAPETRTPAQAAIVAASIEGDRKTLRADSAIPAAMAVLYLLLLLHFKAKGGYRVVKIEEVESA